MTDTLGSRVAARDAAGFVGRTAELHRLAPWVSVDPPGAVVLIHGPAGVGKSALLRELGRRATAAGREVVHVEARDLPPIAEALDAALAPARALQRPLVVLDSWELLAGLEGHLRDVLLPALPGTAVVVIASRRPPGRAWFTGGWEQVVLDVPLAPLDEQDADALLAAKGLDDPQRRADVVVWAAGSPLALVLAADAPPPVGVTGEPPPKVADALLRCLLDAQPDEEHVDVLAVAALARVTTPALLASALPGTDGHEAFAWLRRQAFAESLGDGVTLHDLLGRALRADMRRRAPERERELRRRIADALYAEATRLGLLTLTLDLQHLVRNQAIRWGFAWDPSGRVRVDAVRDAELADLAAADQPAAAWHTEARALLAAAPDRVVGARDLDDALAGYVVAASPANAPAAAAGDPILGPRLRHAADNVAGGAAFVCRQAIDLTGTEASTVMGVLGIASVLGSGVANPLAAYLPVVRGDAAAEAFTVACGARRLDELAVEHNGVVVECHVIDYGPGGLLSFQREAVYRELGLGVPEPPSVVGVDPELVRDALRDFGSPARLAASPLAPASGTPSERAAGLRSRLAAAVGRAFGDAAEDRALRAVLERGYLDPAPTHEQAADELGLSRAAYFRRLREAVERVSAELGG